MRLLVCGIVAASVCIPALAHAQLPATSDGPGLDPRTTRGGSTDIPIRAAGATEVLGTEGVGASTAPAAVPLEQPLDADAYICGPGDAFELNFWGQQNFRLRVAADLEGKAFISKVGFVAVAGKTLTAVRAEVNKKVRANYPGLQFALALLSPRSFLVNVAEYVARPGGYAANPLERVSTVLARAGGTTGSRRRISIKRLSGATLTADLVLYELTGDTTYNPYVLDGDLITVPPPGVVVSITGSVRRPGSYELVKTTDLTELFELAGGFTSSLVRTLPLRIVRRNASQQESFVDLTFSGSAPPNAALQDDDRVVVRSSEELQRTVQLIGAVIGADALDLATTAKRLLYIEGDTVRSLIDRAGGIRTAGDLTRSYISRPTSSGEHTLIAIDLDRLLVRRDFGADVTVQMGDTIVVPPMQYSVRVEGAVSRAGLYPYNPRFGIAEYVATAGGRTRSARALDAARIIESSGRSRTFSSTLKPRPGDAIVIPERSFTSPEIVQIVLSTAGLILSGVAITLAATR